MNYKKIHIPTPSKASLVKIILGILIVVLVVYFIRKWTKKDPQESTTDEAQKQIIEYELSYELSQYAIFCDKLEVAFEDFGTDEDAVYSIFDQMQNDSDLAQLIVTYGKRQYWGNYIPMSLNLPETIYQEMTRIEIDRINEILSLKGIRFKL